MLFPGGLSSQRPLLACFLLELLLRPYPGRLSCVLNTWILPRASSPIAEHLLQKLLRKDWWKVDFLETDCPKCLYSTFTLDGELTWVLRFLGWQVFLRKLELLLHWHQAFHVAVEKLRAFLMSSHLNVASCLLLEACGFFSQSWWAFFILLCAPSGRGASPLDCLPLLALPDLPS